jgi:hypothetical protein
MADANADVAQAQARTIASAVAASSRLTCAQAASKSS